MLLRHYVTSVNIKSFPSFWAIACKDPAGGGLFIALSHSNWNNYIYVNGGF